MLWFIESGLWFFVFKVNFSSLSVCTPLSIFAGLSAVGVPSVEDVTSSIIFSSWKLVRFLLMPSQHRYCPPQRQKHLFPEPGSGEPKPWRSLRSAEKNEGVKVVPSKFLSWIMLRSSILCSNLLSWGKPEVEWGGLYLNPLSGVWLPNKVEEQIKSSQVYGCSFTINTYILTQGSELAILSLCHVMSDTSEPTQI